MTTLARPIIKTDGLFHSDFNIGNDKYKRIREKILSYSPKGELGRIVKQCFPFLPPELAYELWDKILSSTVIESSLAIKVFRQGKLSEDLGIVSRKVVTTAGVNAIVDAFQNTVELENFKYHGMGTGVAAEAAGDTALGTELTTQYNPDSTRVTGSTTEGGGANVYRTVGTNTIDSGTPAVTEHGVFTSATVAMGTLLDRSVFAAINLVANDGINFTYDLTFSSGG